MRSFAPTCLPVVVLNTDILPAGSMLGCMDENQFYHRSDAAPADRRGHFFIIGSHERRVEEMLIDAIKDMHAGHGLCFIDLDGSASPTLLDAIPRSWTHEVIYWEFTRKRAIGYNLLEHEHKDETSDIAKAIASAFEDIWGTTLIGPRTVQVLTNGIISLADLWRVRKTPSLYSLIKLYTNSEYKNYVVSHTRDADVREFWKEQFTKWEKDQNFTTQALAPLQNKLSHIFNNVHLKATFAQNTSSISLPSILSSSKILIINLKKLVHDNAILFLSLFLPQLYFAGKQRAEQTDNPQDFFLYIPDLGDIGKQLGIPSRILLSFLKTTHHNINLTIGSKSAIPREAEFNGCESILAFKCGAKDVGLLEAEFGDLRFTDRKITEGFMRSHSAVGRYMNDGTYGETFWTEMPRLEYANHGRGQSIIRYSFNHHYRSRSSVERKLARFRKRWAVQEPQDEMVGHKGRKRGKRRRGI